MRKLKNIVRAAVSSFVALVIALSGIGVIGSPASAAIPTGNVRNFYFVLDEQPSTNQMIRYSNFIAVVREAASNWSDSRGGPVTQSNEGFLQITLESRELVVNLWLDPMNMYLLGYSTSRGHTWAFSDHADRLRYLFSRTNNSFFNGIQTTNVQSLPFTGNYSSIDATIDTDPLNPRPRSTMGTAFADVRGSIEQLAWAETPNSTAATRRTTARSLRALIGFVSEAVRFNDIEGVFRAGMVGRGSVFNSRHSELENQWGHISSFIVGRSFGANASYTVRLGQDGSHTITTIAEARQYVRVARY